VARDLFNVSFMAAWSEMNESQQDDFLSSLQHALRAQDIPEVTQALLNLTEFMEHSDKVRVLYVICSL
jgi:FKBP12-rapamycin complex-associated protein